MRYSVILMVLVVLVPALAPAFNAAGVAQMQDADGPKNGLSAREVVAGRNFTSVEVGGSTFGILHGTEESPGHVTIFMLTPRYIGDAELEDSDGTSLGKRAIEAITYSEHTVLSLIQFSDGNDNGLYDATTYSTTDNTSVKSEMRRAIASLHTAWELELEESSVGSRTFYVFTLTARNVSVMMSTGTVQSRSALGMIELEIVLEVDQEASEDKIPVYDVTLDIRSNNVRSVSRNRVRTANTVHTSGRFKYNVTIEDWPTDANGDKLILLTTTKVGVAASRATMKWAGERLLEKLGATGEARFTSEDDTDYRTTTDIRQDSNTDGIPESIQARERVRFADNGHVLADLTWVDNATVDRNETRVRFSLLKVGGIAMSRGSRTFRGVSVLGGFVYPAGSHIFHDPGIEGEATEVAFDDVIRELLPSGTILIQVIAGATVAVLAFARRRK